jgi:DNA-binding transcriptional LysR family regulator
LEAFYLVVKRGSFTKAAEELNVTQPAVTMQVKSLERSLNLKLIQQLGKRVQLSEAGELLYQYAGKIFDLADEANEKMRDFKKLMRGPATLCPLCFLSFRGDSHVPKSS